MEVEAQRQHHVVEKAHRMQQQRLQQKHHIALRALPRPRQRMRQSRRAPPPPARRPVLLLVRSCACGPCRTRSRAGGHAIL